MSRRGSGEGSVYRRQRDGRWVGAVSLDGRKRKTFYGRTRAEVAAKLTVALKAKQDGLPMVKERQTLANYLTQWLEAVKPTLRPESFRRYNDFCQLHIIPELGKIPVARLTPQQVQTAYTRCLETGLSRTSVQLMHGILHKALKQAMRWGLAQRNVTEMIDPPRRSTPEMQALTVEEASRLLEAVRSERLEAFYVLAITCGLRLGELQALRWREVDLDGGKLRVTATLQGTENGKPVFAEPKTARSRREVHMSAVAVDALRRHRLIQLQERIRRANEWQDFDLVFTNELGRPLDGNNFRQRAFAKVLKKAGLPPMRFHDLRHTAATLLMSQGIPVKIASEMLGHADISTTLRIYSHVLPGMQQQAADAMDRLFG